jgi:predicted phage tail protein
MSVEELLTIEQRTFTQQMGRMASLLIDSELKSIIAKTVHLIDEEVQHKRNIGQPVDYQFYSRALTDLERIAGNPQDMVAAQRLRQLAETTSGHPVLSKKLAGALLVVLGFLLISASVAGLVVTFGGSSALSAGGISVGVALAGAGCSLGAVTGIGVTFFGKSKFVSGMRKGISKELVEIQHDVESSAQSLAAG